MSRAFCQLFVQSDRGTQERILHLRRLHAAVKTKRDSNKILRREYKDVRHRPQQKTVLKICGASVEPASMRRAITAGVSRLQKSASSEGEREGDGSGGAHVGRSAARSHLREIQCSNGAGQTCVKRQSRVTSKRDLAGRLFSK